MELWTRSESDACWREWPSPIQALAGLDGRPATEVLLVSRAPDFDLPELTAAVGLARRIAGPGTEIIVGTPHPSDRWRRALRELGVDHLWWVASERPPEGACEQDPDVEEINGSVCPALHSQTREHATLSVCGRHEDRLVLAPRYLREWCLGNYRACPQWRNGKRG